MFPNAGCSNRIGSGRSYSCPKRVTNGIWARFCSRDLARENQGFLSTRDLQMDVYGENRAYATEFVATDGELATIDFVSLAQSFGIEAECVFKPGEVGPAVKRALDRNAPGLVEVTVNRKYPYSGGGSTGWWDVPVPKYLNDRRKTYEQSRKEEKLGF